MPKLINERYIKNKRTNIGFTPSLLAHHPHTPNNCFSKKCFKSFTINSTIDYQYCKINIFSGHNKIFSNVNNGKKGINIERKCDSYGKL